MNPTHATALALLARELDGADTRSLHTAYASARALRANLAADEIDLTPETILAALVGADLEAKVQTMQIHRTVVNALRPGATLPPPPEGRVSRPIRLTLAAIARDLLRAEGIHLTPTTAQEG